jgi:hypothetical protein
MRRVFASVIAVATGIGCTSSVDATDRPLTVSLTLAPGVAPAPTLVVDVDGATARVTGRDAPGPSPSVTIRAPRTGERRVRATLLVGTTDTIVQLFFSQEFRTGYEHGVSGYIGSLRPFGPCVGKIIATPTRGRASDTLFLSYGSSPREAIC